MRLPCDSAPRFRFAAVSVAVLPVLHLPGRYQRAIPENYPIGTEPTWAGRRLRWKFSVTIIDKSGEMSPFLEAGFDTVGTHVDVYHLAAAPIGAVVTFTAEVTAVDGRRIQFRVEAWDETEKIGEGTHERAIINVAKFATRLAEKKL